MTVEAALDGVARAQDTAVTIHVSGGTASAPADFADIGTVTVTITQGQTRGTQAFNFTPVNDSVDEGLSETVVFRGTAPELAVGTATLTITDDDGKGNFAHRKTAMGNYRPALRSFHPVLTVLDQDHLDLPLHRMGRPHMTTPVPLSSD